VAFSFGGKPVRAVARTASADTGKERLRVNPGLNLYLRPVPANALPVPAGLDPPNGLDGNGATGLLIPIGLLIPTGLFITTGLLITTGLFTKIGERNPKPKPKPNPLYDSLTLGTAAASTEGETEERDQLTML